MGVNATFVELGTVATGNGRLRIRLRVLPGRVGRVEIHAFDSTDGHTVLFPTGDELAAMAALLAAAKDESERFVELGTLTRVEVP